MLRTLFPQGKLTFLEIAVLSVGLWAWSLCIHLGCSTALPDSLFSSRLVFRNSISDWVWSSVGFHNLDKIGCKINRWHFRLPSGTVGSDYDGLWNEESPAIWQLRFPRSELLSLGFKTEHTPEFEGNYWRPVPAFPWWTKIFGFAHPHWGIHPGLDQRPSWTPGGRLLWCIMTSRSGTIWTQLQ